MSSFPLTFIFFRMVKTTNQLMVIKSMSPFVCQPRIVESWLVTLHDFSISMHAHMKNIVIVPSLPLHSIYIYYIINNFVYLIYIYRNKMTLYIETTIYRIYSTYTYTFIIYIYILCIHTHIYIFIFIHTYFLYIE